VLGKTYIIISRSYVAYPCYTA